MDFKDLLKTRRSVRNFQNKKVPSKIIHELIDDACIAPSACNRQPWRFIVIQNADLMKKISDECKKNSLLLIQKHPEPFLKQFESLFKNPHYNVFYNAPALVIICGEKSHYYLREDCTLAASYFMLAATERKLGTCWIAWGDKIEDFKLRKEIGLTDDLQIVAPLILGYPVSIPELPKREEPIVLKEISEF